MKLKSLSIAVALACAAASGSAMALTANNFSSGSSTLQFHISGSSAQQKGFEAFMRDICVANTLDSYTLSANGNLVAYLCTPDNTNSAFGFTGTYTQLAVYYSLFGSAYGFAPVARQVAPNAGDSKNTGFLDFTKLNTSGLSGCTSSAVSNGNTSVLSPFTAWKCTGGSTVTTTAVANNTSLVAPDAGFLDVEPSLFVGVPAGTVTGATTDLSKVTVSSLYQVVFGVPVTTVAYRALQSAEGLTQDDSEANMPTLNKGQIASLLTGQVANWSALGVTLANDSVAVAARPQSSGTRAMTDAYFTGLICGNTGATALAVIANGLDSNTPYTGGGVTAPCGGTDQYPLVSSGTDMRACFTAANSANIGMIGMLTTEDAFRIGTGSPEIGYRFIKINGKAPTLYNVAEGSYDYFAEAAFAKYKNLTGDKNVFANYIATNMGKPSEIAALVTDFATQGTVTWAQSPNATGLIAISAKGTVPTAAFTASTILSNPVNPYTRSASGSTSNCQLPVALSYTDAGK